MKTPSQLSIKQISLRKKVVTFSVADPNVCILGSSIPLITPRGQPITLFSIPLEKHTDILLFLWCKNSKSADSATFLCLEHQGAAWYAATSEIPTFPYEMFVIGNAITVRLERGLVSTEKQRGTYRITCDTMCRLLIGDIAEDEIFAEETDLRRLCGLDDEPKRTVQALPGTRKEKR